MIPPNKAPSVLVVDDDEFIYRYITIALEHFGIEEVTTATDGHLALKALECRSDQVDLIFCDLNMPNMDGIEFLRHLNTCRYKGMIILISSSGRRLIDSVAELGRLHDLNIIGTIEKPLSFASLKKVLVKVFEPESKNDTKIVADITEDQVRSAVNEQQLLAFYQPQVDALTRKVIGLEALVRWEHPTLGIIEPYAFLSIVSHCGLLNLMTDFILEQVITQSGIWKRAGQHFKVSVNIPIEYLKQLDLPDRIIIRVIDEGIEASDITLEVTEGGLMKDVSVTLDILSRLRLKGFGLSIDDFGTGYSSLEQLQRIPFNELKIDRQFVHYTLDNSDAKTILESTIDMAKKLNFTIVAEGVETQAEWDLVTRLGCHLVQGNFVARPMPGETILSFIDEWEQASTQIAF